MQKKTYRGPKTLSQTLNFVTRPIYQKRGFVENKIITDWELIVGGSLSEYSTPRKLTFARDKKSEGILHVEVYDGGMAVEMSYMEPIIVEKIATYFGYKAIAKLKIIQKPGARFLNEKPKVVIKQLSDEQNAALQQKLADIDDEEVREALARLGGDVFLKT